MNPILIVYYTGTGSSKLVAESFADNLSRRDITVETQRLTVASKDELVQKAAAFHSIILIYAVHAFNAPDLVYTWLKALEEQPPYDDIQKKAMVISVSGGGEILSNTACRTTANRLLEKKGFQVVTQAMVVMPNNWMSATPDDISSALIDILPKKVDQWTEAFLQNKPAPVMPTKSIDRLITTLGRLEVKGAVRFGKRIKVSAACNGCGWCERNCPAGNITMQGNMTPTFGKTCHFCLGCIYGCPQKALAPGKYKFSVIPSGYPLKRYMQKPEKPLTEAELAIKLKGLAWNGVRRYLEK